MFRNLTLVAFAVLTGCGSAPSNQRRAPMVDEDGSPRRPEPGSDTYDSEVAGVVRATARIEMDRQGFHVVQDLNLASSPHAMAASVPAAVRFDIDDAGFQTPAATDGLQSYGSLSVIRLRDNNLSVCGSGKERCTTAEIRVYTQDAGSDGLWNASDGYGLPISAGGKSVRYGSGSAVVLGQADIRSLRTVTLANFTSDASLEIPVTVDFSGAGAGDYSATLVLEYILR